MEEMETLRHQVALDRQDSPPSDIPDAGGDISAVGEAIGIAMRGIVRRDTEEAEPLCEQLRRRLKGKAKVVDDSVSEPQAEVSEERDAELRQALEASRLYYRAPGEGSSRAPPSLPSPPPEMPTTRKGDRGVREETEEERAQRKQEEKTQLVRFLLACYDPETFCTAWYRSLAHLRSVEDVEELERTLTTTIEETETGEWNRVIEEEERKRIQKGRQLLGREAQIIQELYKVMQHVRDADLANDVIRYLKEATRARVMLWRAWVYGKKAMAAGVPERDQAHLGPNMLSMDLIL